MIETIIEGLKFLNGLGVDIGSALVGALAIILILRYKQIANTILRGYDTNKRADKRTAEQYTIDSSETINGCLEKIVMSDNRISNAILCNYHNTVSSNVDFSYYYFTAITEALGNRVYQCFDVWSEKSYVNYQPELKSLHRKNCIIINTKDVEDVEAYPKFSKLIVDSKAEMAVIFPLNGIAKPVGLIILLFKDACDIRYKSEYSYGIDKYIDEISLLINYSKS